MKTRILNILLVLVLWSAVPSLAHAQLSFPNGNFLNLVTSTPVLYFETRILFHTGAFHADDYRWEKISDSLDTNWDVSSCFNGDCKNDLTPSGNFITDYGMNDTTCFIAFHVASNKSPGTSVIQYRVLHKQNFQDQATLTFHITYTKPTTGIEEGKIALFTVSPNPVSDRITITFSQHPDNAELTLTNILGQQVGQHMLEHSLSSSIDVSSLPKGVYLATVRNGEHITTQRLLKP